MNLADRPTSVYRLFDGTGRLLYVGMTADVKQRVAHHRFVQPWGHEIESIEYDTYPDRATARAAESETALRLAPIYTVGDGGGGRAQNLGDDKALAEVERLGTLRIQTDTDLRAAVLRAIDGGASVRVVAAAARISTATVQTWKAAARRSR